MHRIFVLPVILILSINLIALDFVPVDEKERIDLARKISNVAENTKTIRSNFIQKKHLSVLSDNIKSSGIFFYQKDDKIRWEYIKPYTYIIIYNGSKILIIDEGKKNQFDAKSNRLFEVINSMMISCIRGNVSNNPDFTFSFYKKNNLIFVKVEPKSPEVKKYIKRIDMFFDKKSLQVNEINIYEESGDYTNIVFNKKEINVPLSENIFNINK